jgi:hypothetical protein
MLKAVLCFLNLFTMTTFVPRGKVGVSEYFGVLQGCALFYVLGYHRWSFLWGVCYIRMMINSFG